MRPRYFTIPVLFITTFIVFLVLRTVSSLPHSAITQPNSLLDQSTSVERTEAPVDTNAPLAETSEPVLTQVTPLQDGPALLESYCTQCHTPRWLQQIKKSRTDWEKALRQMEAMGVRMEEPEKAVLLDYLALADKP